MSVQRDAWTALKSQMSGDTALAAYTKRFKFNRQEEIFQAGFFPILVVFPISIVNEEYIGIPKQKIAKLTINVFGKVASESGDTLEEEMLHYDELIKNAIEKNLQLTDKAIICNIGDSELAYLDKEHAETNFRIVITLPRFTAGSR